MFCIINRYLTLSKIQTDETTNGGQKVDRLENDCVLLNNYKKSAGDQPLQNMIASIDGRLSGGSTAANNHQVYVCLEVTTIKHISQLTSIMIALSKESYSSHSDRNLQVFCTFRVNKCSLHCSSPTQISISSRLNRNNKFQAAFSKRKAIIYLHYYIISHLK